MNFKIRAQRAMFNKTADWLIGVKFQRGFQVTIKCATPCLCHVLSQEPITRSLHLCCTLESILSNEELFLQQAFPRKSIVSEDVNVNEHDCAAH